MIRAMYPDSEIIFPASAIPELRTARSGETWQALIDALSKLPEAHDDVRAFSLMMIRLGNCLTCDLDSYRANLGCIQCAKRSVSSFKASDDALIKKIEEARKEMSAYDNGEDRTPAPGKRK
jgi:hypothetical protein